MSRARCNSRMAIPNETILKIPTAKRNARSSLARDAMDWIMRLCAAEHVYGIPPDILHDVEWRGEARRWNSFGFGGDQFRDSTAAEALPR